MSKKQKHITVFEHESIYFDKGEKRITQDQFKALQNYYGDGSAYFTLCFNGVKFNEHVGVIQIGDTLIEVLPKADKNNDKDEKCWRDVLIGMLTVVGNFDIKLSSHADLTIRPNTILELYFELFIKEIEYLLHQGLTKKYRLTESNSNTFKGKMIFSRQIQLNLIHQERFFVRHTTYDYLHQLHLILYKTIHLLKQLNTNSGLQNRINTLLMHFPEMPDIKVNENTFQQIVYNRKTTSYKKAINIARLLLLHYHPDINKGRNHVFALMFNMNQLWEKFIFTSLRKAFSKSNFRVKAQVNKPFWKPLSGNRIQIRPDIVIEHLNGKNIVLDTKWKDISNTTPSIEDLRQMYVYQEYYNADKVALVYPGYKTDYFGSYLQPETGKESKNSCGIISLNVTQDIHTWQKYIGEHINNFIDLAESKKY